MRRVAVGIVLCGMGVKAFAGDQQDLLGHRDGRAGKKYCLHQESGWSLALRKEENNSLLPCPTSSAVSQTLLLLLVPWYPVSGLQQEETHHLISSS